MAMMEMYPQIRESHVGMIMLSGGWMTVRLLFAAFGMNWPRHIAARIVAWTIDGLVLTFAAMLFTMLPKEMFANGWIWVKILFVVIYYALGYMALGKTHTRTQLIVMGVLAMAAYAMAYGIARAHHPLGWFVGM